MANKFKKGDKVYYIHDWNGFGAVKIEELTIQSWGAKRGTATRTCDTEYLTHQIYTNQMDDLHRFGPWTMVSVEDGYAAAEVAAIRIGNFVEARQRAHYEKIQSEGDSGRAYAAKYLPELGVRIV